MRFCIGLGFSPIDHYVPLAKAADERGWDTICVSDHVVNPETITSTYPYTADGGRRWEPFTPWADPWVAIGAMAGVTEQLRFTTNVYVLPMRTPFHVAKVVATAAAISGGRVALGVGMGWMAEEFAPDGAALRQAGQAGRRDARGAPQAVGRRAGSSTTASSTTSTGSRARRRPATCRCTSAASPSRRCAGPPATTAGSATCTRPTSCARSAGSWPPTGSSSAREREPFHVLASCKDAWDLDGYRRLEEVGVTHLVTQPWLFYAGETDDVDRPGRGHPPLRRRHPRPLLTRAWRLLSFLRWARTRGLPMARLRTMAALGARSCAPARRVHGDDDDGDDATTTTEVLRPARRPPARTPPRRSSRRRRDARRRAGGRRGALRRARRPARLQHPRRQR